MTTDQVKGLGTREHPWVLKTPSGGAEFQAFRDETLDPPALVVQVGKTELRYHLRCLTDLQAMLKKHSDWMPLGSADEQKPAAEGTVEAWGRAEDSGSKGSRSSRTYQAPVDRSPEVLCGCTEVLKNFA